MNSLLTLVIAGGALALALINWHDANVLLAGLGTCGIWMILFKLEQRQ